MAKAIIHAESSARKWGGSAQDYFAIHEFLDSSKGPGGCSSNAHRALLHHSNAGWVCDRVFGPTFEVTVDVKKAHPDGSVEIVGQRPKTISTRDILEQHLLEDNNGKYMPTLADYLVSFEVQDWMRTQDHDSALDHARRSVTEFGGVVEDFLPIHELMNIYASSTTPERSLIGLHHTFGVWVMEQAFGYEVMTSEGDLVPVKKVAAAHIEYDLGWLPAAQDYLDHLAYQPWFTNSIQGCPESYRDKTVPDSYRKIEKMKEGRRVTRRQVYKFD